MSGSFLKSASVSFTGAGAALPAGFFTLAGAAEDDAADVMVASGRGAGSGAATGAGAAGNGVEPVGRSAFANLMATP